MSVYRPMTYVRFDFGLGNVQRQTAKAVCLDMGRGRFWLPKSQIEVEWPTTPASSGTITLPLWLARKSGLWGYSNDGRPICEIVD